MKAFLKIAILAFTLLCFNSITSQTTRLSVKESSEYNDKDKISEIILLKTLERVK